MRPTEPSAAAAHGARRSRRLVGGIASSLVSRGIGLLAPLILIPLALSSMGVERYGLWAAATSLTAMALFSDFGLGNGLMTRLSEACATGRSEGARQDIVAGLSFTAVTASAIILGTSVVTAWADPVSWIDPGTSIPAGEGDVIVWLCLAGFAVNIPLSLIQRVQYAYQDVTYSNLWTAAGSLASVGAFATAVALGAPPVVQIAAAVALPPIVNVVNAAVYFTGRHPELSPLGARPTRQRARGLLRLSGAFFVLSIVSSVALNLDQLLISRALGLEAAAAYSVAFRVSSSVGLVVTLVNLPLWPANGEALARGDLPWVRRTTRRMVAVSGGLALAAAAALLLIGPLLFGLWLGRSKDTLDLGVLALLLVWMLLLAVASPLFMVQNAAGLAGPQLLGWALYLVVSVPAKWIGLHEFGLAAAPAASCLAYVVFVLPAALIGVRRALRRGAPHEPVPEFVPPALSGEAVS